MPFKPKKIEVLRPGTFQPMAGAPVSFTADDLRAIARSYDAAGAPAPAVVGHPSTDAPAYGWISSLAYDDEADRLIAELGEVEPQFEQLVADGRFKRVSLSLFGPAAPNNPLPGAWYPKHLGFLGAAAPAVSGLKPVAFSGDVSGVVEIELGEPALRDVAGLFRSLRDFLIEKFGLETADRALSPWSITWIDEQSQRETSTALPAFAAPSLATQEPPMSATNPAPDAAALAARAAALDARERALAHADNLAFAERLVAERRLLPALRERVVGLLDGLTPVGGAHLEVSFADGGETRNAPARDLVREILQAQPQVVSFGALDAGAGPQAGTVDFALPDGARADPVSADLHARALAWQAQHRGTDYLAAIAAVSR